jgi:hypothetical protein
MVSNDGASADEKLARSMPIIMAKLNLKTTNETQKKKETI